MFIKSFSSSNRFHHQVVFIIKSFSSSSRFHHQIVVIIKSSSSSSQSIKSIYQVNLSSQSIKSIYQVNLSSQFIKSIYQVNLLSHFIKSLYQVILSNDRSKHTLRSYCDRLLRLLATIACYDRLLRSLLSACYDLIKWLDKMTW